MSIVRALPLATALLSFLLGTTISAQESTTFEQQGRQLLEHNCSRCHAVGKTGDSPHRSAPTFRTLGQRYPIESLAEALAEGLSTGHSDMPEFTFKVFEVTAIIAYLDSIQELKRTQRQR